MLKSVSRVVMAAMAICLAVSLDIGPLYADSPQEAIEARRAGMKQLGAQMKGVGGFLKGGRRAGTADTVALRAQSMAAFADKIPGLFPKGSGMDDGVGETGAKAAIWQDWDGFKKAAMALRTESEKLAAAADTGDKEKIKAAMGSIGKVGCGGCHRTYRQKLGKK